MFYFSQQITTAQINYSASEKELLAVILAVENFNYYLTGKEFLLVIVGDLFGAKIKNARLHRLRLILLEYKL